MDLYREGVFKEKGLDVRQARSMVQDMNEWLGFVMENAWGIDRGMNF